MVMFQLDSDFDGFIQGGRVGKITSAYIDPNTSEVMYGVRCDAHAGIALLGKNLLAFVVGTTIKYSPTGSFDNGNCRHGKVILCRTVNGQSPQVLYTIMIFGPDKTDGEFQVVKDVTLDQVRCID
jgi:hypothetical protein